MKNKKDKQKLIVKSNYLNEASYKLTLQEARVIFLLISKIKKDDKDLRVYRFKIKELADYIGLKDPNYTNIKKIVIGLLDKKLNIKNKKKGIDININWLSGSMFKIGSGYIDLEFSSFLKPYLLQLKHFFMQYEIQNVLNLKSFYSIRMYELLKQYEDIGNRTITVEELKRILQITTKSYKLYSNIKKKIILKTQAEILEKTDISFEFEEIIKGGKKVIAIKFNIFKKKPPLKIKKTNNTDINHTTDSINNNNSQNNNNNNPHQKTKAEVFKLVKEIEEICEDQKYHNNYVSFAWKLKTEDIKKILKNIKEKPINIKNKGKVFHYRASKLHLGFDNDIEDLARDMAKQTDSFHSYFFFIGMIYKIGIEKSRQALAEFKTDYQDTSKIRNKGALLNTILQAKL